MNDVRSRLPETEKITTNLGLVDLGQIDLLVREGFYSNRTDFIRTAIRGQLERHGDAVKQVIGRRELEAVRDAGEQLNIQVLGLAIIAPDVSAELARTTLASLEVLSALHASDAVKAALRDRMR